MSATDTHTTESYTCSHCDGERSPETSVRGSFCSAACYYRHRGTKALHAIRQDHRFCGSCFRRIKTTSRPAERTLQRQQVSLLVREAFVGYQDRTEHATVGVDEFDRDAERNHALRVEGTRLSCRCGTVDPQDEHEVLRDLDTRATVISLWRALVALERDGTLQQRPTRGDYFDAFREAGPDWAYATGRALYAATD
jgi:hypothetical protein